MILYILTSNLYYHHHSQLFLSLLLKHTSTHSHSHYYILYTVHNEMYNVLQLTGNSSFWYISSRSTKCPLKLRIDQHITTHTYIQYIHPLIHLRGFYSTLTVLCCGAAPQRLARRARPVLRICGSVAACVLHRVETVEPDSSVDIAPHTVYLHCCSGSMSGGSC